MLSISFLVALQGYSELFADLAQIMERIGAFFKQLEIMIEHVDIYKPIGRGLRFLDIRCPATFSCCTGSSSQVIYRQVETSWSLRKHYFLLIGRRNARLVTKLERLAHNMRSPADHPQENETNKNEVNPEEPAAGGDGVRLR